MKQHILLNITYIITLLLLTLATFDGEEIFIQDWQMAAVLVVMHMFFLIVWAQQVKRMKNISTLHKSLFLIVVFYGILTIGDLLFFQNGKAIIIYSVMLVATIIIAVRQYRHDVHIVDAFISASMLLVICIAAQFGGAILPTGLVIVATTAFVYIIIGVWQSLFVTIWFARILFFLIAGDLVLLLNVWPLFDESNYLLYVVLLICIGSLFIGKKREFLLPQNMLRVVVGMMVIITIVKMVQYIM